MSWVVDTCVIIDVLEDASEHNGVSVALLKRLAPDGLLLCPVSFVELAPAFEGDIKRQCDFLDETGIRYKLTAWLMKDTYCAHAAWYRQVAARRAGVAPRRPMADILIGAFAMRHDGLVTRNPSDFADIFPSLAIRVP